MTTKKQDSLFGDQALTLEQAIDKTTKSLLAHYLNYDHWAVAYSGGKDNTALITLIAYLLKTCRIPWPKSLVVLYADTRMELPPLHAGAMATLGKLRDMGIDTQVVLPNMDDRFFVYLFGRGVPPPSNRFRWCTSQIKIEPMEAALLAKRQHVGKKLLMLTGVRLGESAMRDDRIVTSCSRDGAECGQGWFQSSTPESVADTLAPIRHFRVCHVWDWLMFNAPEIGFDTRMLAEVYGGDEATEINARTGCVGCNLASRDMALESLIKQSDWMYLQPLMRLREVYSDLKLPQNRLRKNGEIRLDGSPSSNQGRMGPLTIEARRVGLNKILAIQTEVNSKANGRPEIDLINEEEHCRIIDLIDANTWPNKWDGTEIRGDVILPLMYTKGGGIQSTMHELAESVK